MQVSNFTACERGLLHNEGRGIAGAHDHKVLLGIRDAPFLQCSRADRHQPEGLTRRLKVPAPHGQHAILSQMIVIIQESLSGVQEVFAEAVGPGSGSRPGVYL